VGELLEGGVFTFSVCEPGSATSPNAPFGGRNGGVHRFSQQIATLPRLNSEVPIDLNAAPYLVWVPNDPNGGPTNVAVDNRVAGNKFTYTLVTPTQITGHIKATYMNGKTVDADVVINLTDPFQPPSPPSP
jgi:hypothetical protein